MTTATIIFLIDLQNGFSRFDIPQKKGGCLYVPGGEEAIAPAVDLITRSKNGIFVLSQDFHPENHVSFMENHKGVMEMRREHIKTHHKDSDIEQAVLDPRLMPFSDIKLRKRNGVYEPIACRVGCRWHKVDTNFFRQIVHIEPDIIPPEKLTDTLEQKLWRKHCVKGSESALFDEKLMAVLPEDLALKLREDLTSPVLRGADANGNRFIVIRKGMHSDLDSYGIATENDGISQTQAPVVLAELAQELRTQGVTHADIDIGGLATNFCAEFSEQDLHKHLLPILHDVGIKARLHFLSDISRGIPIATPDGSWPDLDNTLERMKARGTAVRTTEDVIRSHMSGLRWVPTFLQPGWK